MPFPTMGNPDVYVFILYLQKKPIILSLFKIILNFTMYILTVLKWPFKSTCH